MWRCFGALITDGLKPLGPCTHAVAGPLLKGKGDAWCVTDVYWKRPPITREVDHIVGIDRRRLTVSWLGLSKKPPAADAAGKKYEVLSRPMRSKTGWLLYLCGGEGRVVASMEKPPSPVPPRGRHVTLPGSVRPAGCS